MKKVCIVYETGNGRLAGHYTQFAFSGLRGVEIAALADGNEAAEKTLMHKSASMSGEKPIWQKSTASVKAVSGYEKNPHFRRISSRRLHSGGGTR